MAKYTKYIKYTNLIKKGESLPEEIIDRGFVTVQDIMAHTGFCRTQTYHKIRASNVERFIAGFNSHAIKTDVYLKNIDKFGFKVLEETNRHMMQRIILNNLNTLQAANIKM